MSELQEIKISWGMIEIFYGNIGVLFSENLNPLQFTYKSFYLFNFIIYLFIFVCVPCCVTYVY